MNAVCVQPLGTVDEEIVDAIEEGIRAVFKLDVHRMDGEITPGYAFDAKRRQYSSELILRNMAKHYPDNAFRLLAATHVDLFIPMLTFVYGQAQLNGRVSIVSTARMHQEFYGLTANRSLTVLRTLKESLHELGHTFGLTHCSVQECLMSIATDIGHLDRKGKDLCRSCQARVDRSVARLTQEQHESH